MSKRKSRSLTLIAGILVTGFLVSFFLYMWRYDYRVQRPQEYQAFGSRTLRGTLRMDLKNDSGFAGPVALITVANISSGRVRLLDTRRIQPLYQIQLQVKNPSGVWEDVTPLPDLSRRTAAQAKDVFDKDQDAIAELVSGAAYTRAIPLTYLYNFPARTQSYQITLIYQPTRIAEIMGDTFDFLEVSRENVTLNAVFEYPVPPAKPVSAKTDEPVDNPKE